MRTAAILLLCILGAALFCTVSSTSSTGPDICCFKFFPGRLSPSRIRSFILTDDRCPKAGVILVTNKKFNICVKPSDAWVQEILQMLVGPPGPPAGSAASPALPNAPPPAAPPALPTAPPPAAPPALPTAPPPAGSHSF